MFHVALYHPAIPQNTGNIARTTVGFGAHLHLIHPMKFEITDHAVKRAGLDYWPSVQLTQHENDNAFLAWLDQHCAQAVAEERSDEASDHAHQRSRPQVWLITKFGDTRFDRADYRDGDVFIFGNENTGLPETWHDRFPRSRLNIPMPGPADGAPNIRSLNVANTVAIVLATAVARTHHG